jgi:hypothetical protein
MEKEESVFSEEIEHGITLWESKDESRIWAMFKEK